MDDPKEREIKEVMAEEGRRGRRPIDLKARKQRQDRLAGFRSYLRLATEDEFVKAMLALGLREGSKELLSALELWREFRD